MLNMTDVPLDDNPVCVDNDTCSVDSPNLSPINENAIQAVYAAIGSLGFLGNCIVIVVIAIAKGMRSKVTNLYILNQSLIDLVASIFILIQGTVPMNGTGLTPGSLRDELLCKLMLARTPLWAMLISSTANLVVLTLERYFAIVHPIAHKVRFTKKRAVIGIIFAWVFGPSYMLVYMITSQIVDGVCYPFSAWPSKRVETAVAVLGIFAHFFIPLFIMIFCYARIYMLLMKRSNTVDVQTASTTNHMSTGYERARRNVIKTLVLVCVSFFICWIWNDVLFLLSFAGYQIDFGSPFYHFSVVAVFANSCNNPIIYAFTYKEFQKELRTFCRHCLRRSPYDTDVHSNSTIQSTN